MTRGNREAGFTYLAVLFALVVFGLGAAWIGETYSRSIKREREQELLEIGIRMREAIAAYYAAAPGSIATLPRSLDDLVLDTRFVGVRRYMRRIEWDPVGRVKEWGLVYGPDGGITGIYSRSNERPLRAIVEGLPGGARLTGERYSDWKFVFEVPQS